MTAVVIVCLLIAAACGAWVVAQASARARLVEGELDRIYRALVAAEEGLELLAETGDPHAQALAASTLRAVRRAREPRALDDGQ